MMGLPSVISGAGRERQQDSDQQEISRTDRVFGPRVLAEVAHRPAPEGPKDLVGARYLGELLGCLECALELRLGRHPVVIDVLLVLEVAGRARPAAGECKQRVIQLTSSSTGLRIRERTCNLGWAC
jgi:hypothetical protein